MTMNKNHCTRREFLKAAGLGVAAVGVSSCASTPGAPPETRPFTFAQICDPQLGMGGYEHDLKTFQQAIVQINSLKTDFAVICGDLVDRADERSFADFNRVKAAFEIPCYCVPGNHDVGNEPTPESLRVYRKAVGRDYYSFEHKGYVFVCVNTQLWKAPVNGESDKHDSWLDATLETAARRNAQIFVVGHHPLFLKKPDEPEAYFNLPLAKRRNLLSLFEKQGVVAVLNGHTHRLLINEYQGIQLVNGETTCKNFDKRPFGFRLWHVMDPRPFKHDFVPLEGFQEVEKDHRTSRMHATGGRGRF
jgi:3',5'-cyclic AMP phosphodiesterase CpdA